jgi:hypothetical protein
MKDARNRRKGNVEFGRERMRGGREHPRSLPGDI